MVIRILPGKMVFSMDKLGFDDEQMVSFKKLLDRPHGIIFLTGPTGSGKSTTLYAGLSSINTVERKVITIEDPVEYEVEGITQIQVLPEIGLTFARGLRSMLRHDPDIMMVGEVRDLETADISIRMALTGHLLLSTLHTNDAASGVTRLLDIGVEPYLITSSVIAFIAQRLIRVICSSCKQEDKEVLPEIRQMAVRDLGLSSDYDLKFYKGTGCEICNGTGFSGRIAILEVLLINEEIRKLVFSHAAAEEIKEKAVQLGMRTLRQSGWKKVLDGIVTADEVLKITPADGTVLKAHGTQARVIGNLESPDLPIAERRKYIRIKIKVKVIFQAVGFPAAEEKGKEKPQKETEFEAETENVSAGGIVFVAREPFRVDDILDLKLILPDKEKNIIQLLSKVVRVSQITDSAAAQNQFLFRIAVSFLAITSPDRKRIEIFCMDTNVDEKV
jgi:Tfp pilus assembly pilus retraction ATPase PilT